MRECRPGKEKTHMKMTIRMAAGSAALALGMFGAQAMVAAPVSGLAVPVHALFGKNKMITVKVQNASGGLLTIKAGDQQITVQPGMTGSLKVLEGTQIVNVNETAKLTAGAVIATAASSLNGSTLTVN